MKKEEDALLKFCRYYHKEEKIPQKKAEDPDFRFLWSAERMWYERAKDAYDFSTELDNYIASDMTHFEETDDTPVTMKAFLFCYFSSCNERATLDDFKKFYKEHYN